ncbi:MAG: lipoprotein [Legionellales bacterium]
MKCIAVVLLACVALLSSCGQKGPLYLPEPIPSTAAKQPLL